MKQQMLKLLWNPEKLLIVILSCISLLLIFWSVNRGVLFSDESWYLLHTAENQSVFFTHWYSYYAALFFKEITLLRIETIFLLLISSGICTYILFHRETNALTEKTFLFGLTIVGVYCFQSPVQYVPNYMTLNSILLNVSFGLFYLECTTSKDSKIPSLLNGFLHAQICFIMPTNTLLIAFQLVFYEFVFKKRDKSIFYILGIFGGILIYFMFFQSAAKFIADFNFHLSNMVFDTYHGGSVIQKWLIETILYLAKWIAISFIVFKLIKQEKRGIQLLGFVFLTCVLLWDLFLMEQEYHNIHSASYLICLPLIFLFEQWKTTEDNRKWMIIAALGYAIVCSFGTNVPFYIRLSMYTFPLILCTYYLGRLSKIVYLKKLFYIFILLTASLFIFKGFFTRGWQDYVISEQSTPVRTIHIEKNIKLDDERLEQVKEIQIVIPRKSNVIISYQPYYGFVYLLDLKLPYLYFHFNPDQLIFHYKKGAMKGTYYLLEKRDYKFRRDIFMYCKLIKTYRTKTLQDLTIYKVKF